MFTDGALSTLSSSADLKQNRIAQFLSVAFLVPGREEQSEQTLQPVHFSAQTVHALSQPLWSCA